MITLQSLPPAPIAAALGVFDGLHIGHGSLIGTMVKQASLNGLTPCILTFCFDKDRPLAKGQARHLFTKEQRAAIAKNMGVNDILEIDFAQVKNLSPQEFVENILRDTLGVKLVCVGESFRFGNKASGNAAELERLCNACGIEVIISPIVHSLGVPVSATRIRACIANGDIPLANSLLGRCFAIDFTVVHGRALGRTIAAPTINQPFPAGFIQPKFGVYASVITINGVRHSGVSNVGVKPTVGSDHVLAETFIQGYNGDLYGKNVLVEFLQYLRAEIRFDTIDELREQIQKDSNIAIKISSRYL